MKRRILIPIGMATLALATLAGSPAARAAGVVGNGTAASCTDDALNAALADGGPVTFDCGPDVVTIDVSPGAGGTGTKTISHDTTIDGAGMITISGGHSVLVFSVTAGVTFAVQNLTIADGNGGGSGYGGGISSRGGRLIVSNSTFSRNTTGHGGYGGGISSRDGATLTVSNSTFSDNTAPEGIGGGISNQWSAPLVVRNSTFSGNSAYRGGGIFFRDTANGATLTVSNSTFFGNRADGDRGGGILIFPHATGALTVSNCTFFGNSAVTSGGGIQKGCDARGCVYYAPDSAAPLIVANTIVASNAGGNCGSDTESAITDGGHNLDDGTTCGFSTANGSLNDTDPQLDPAGLNDNGGPTLTVALQADSPAINAGDEAVCAAPPVNSLDQRGFVRPGTAATNCSIGAYEYTLPGTSDCCQCPTSCAAPIDGSCGDCDVVFHATCEGGALCVLDTRTPTPSPTPSSPPTLTPSVTPIPTDTPITPSPTPTLGPSACCQCDSFCAAPIHGTCGGCAVVLGASCTNGSLCVARTPPTPTRVCMGDCSGDGQVTIDELITMVNMALGAAATASCPSGLPPADAVSPDTGSTIAAIVTAVNNALDGCTAG